METTSVASERTSTAAQALTTILPPMEDDTEDGVKALVVIGTMVALFLVGLVLAISFKRQQRTTHLKRLKYETDVRASLRVSNNDDDDSTHIPIPSDQQPPANATTATLLASEEVEAETRELTDSSRNLDAEIDHTTSA